MNIVIICQWFPSEYTPIGVMLHELAVDLSSKGHVVTVITGFPNHPSGILFDGYRKKFFTEETVNGVRIVRCYLDTSSNKSVSLRILIYFIFAFTSYMAVMRLKDHVQIPVVFVGSDNGNLRHVKDTARNLGLADRVYFLRICHKGRPDLPVQKCSTIGLFVVLRTRKFAAFGSFRLAMPRHRIPEFREPRNNWAMRHCW